MKDLNKFLGVMIGGAVGDALGSVTEFLRPGMFPYTKDFSGRPKFRSKPGDYTDDTAQALCLAQSLLDCKGFDIEDQLNKYSKWFNEGYMSSQDKAFGIGVQTARQLYQYKLYKEGKISDKPREKDLSGKNKDGNGSLMKIGSIPLYYFNNPEKALLYAGECCKALHNTDICISCAEYFVGLVIGALQGEKKEVLKNPKYSPVKDYWETHQMHETIIPVVNGSYYNKNKSELGIKYGYVVDSLEVALWGFFKFDSFEEGMLEIVNLGYDSDTNACIYGYLAGAYYGYDSIPDRWKNNVTNGGFICSIAEKLYSEGI